METIKYFKLVLKYFLLSVERCGVDYLSTLHVSVCIFQSAAAAPSPVLGNLPPGEGMPVGPVPPGFFQVCGKYNTTYFCICLFNYSIY